jgi:hypothetical protein
MEGADAQDAKSFWNTRGRRGISNVLSLNDAPPLLRGMSWALDPPKTVKPSIRTHYLL